MHVYVSKPRVLKLTWPGRSQDFSRGKHNFPNQPPTPPPSAEVSCGLGNGETLNVSARSLGR